MFDIAFSELMLIGVVALVVIGPERLPKVARTAGQWLGRLNRYASQVKQEIDRDLKLEELRKMQQDMKDTAQRYEILAGETLQRVEETVTQETAEISRAMEAMSGVPAGEAAPAPTDTTPPTTAPTAATPPATAPTDATPPATTPTAALPPAAPAPEQPERAV